MGASVREAAAPYISTAYRVGLAPWLASMATIGLVFLPGMMTGQILGGSPPLTAISYQIAIIIAIHVATELASMLAIRFSMRKGFDELGFLRLEIFKSGR
ncbi:MAG: ABC transporter permease, partial [Deltaproteobacteria bacterium]|nr:ABC transporter permease [Deltaproteobacteria bacterium]